jgi:hypothetical protein
MLRLIGDVHGKHDQYMNLIHNIEYSLQVGDFGFNYNVLNSVSPINHRIIAGNHDNHDICNDFPHFLPKFGYSILGGISFFHVQGAFSIDWRERVAYDQLNNTKSWWENEELTYRELQEAIDLYEKIKPEIMVTHEAPRSVADFFGKASAIIQFGYDPDKFTTRTSEALNEMLNIHKPFIWAFGHYHKSRELMKDKTRFICLDELNYLDI